MVKITRNCCRAWSRSSSVFCNNSAGLLLSRPQQAVPTNLLQGAQRVVFAASQGESSMSTAQGQPAVTPPAAARRARAGGSELQRTQTRLAWLLLLPTLTLIAFVALWPLVQTIWASFTNARLGSIQPTRFVGLSNYAYLLGDTFWWSAVWTTFQFAIITVVFEFILG